MATTPERELAREREQAADDLDKAITALGIAYAEYARLTTQLSDRVGADLARRLDVPLAMHFTAAGLGGFMERKLSGISTSLRTLVEEQHARLGGSR